MNGDELFLWLRVEVVFEEIDLFVAEELKLFKLGRQNGGSSAKSFDESRRFSKSEREVTWYLCLRSAAVNIVEDASSFLPWLSSQKVELTVLNIVHNWTKRVLTNSLQIWTTRLLTYKRFHKTVVIVRGTKIVWRLIIHVLTVFIILVSNIATRWLSRKCLSDGGAE